MNFEIHFARLLFSFLLNLLWMELANRSGHWRLIFEKWVKQSKPSQSLDVGFFSEPNLRRLRFLKPQKLNFVMGWNFGEKDFSMLAHHFSIFWTILKLSRKSKKNHNCVHFSCVSIDVTRKLKQLTQSHWPQGWFMANSKTKVNGIKSGNVNKSCLFSWREVSKTWQAWFSCPSPLLEKASSFFEGCIHFCTRPN